MDLKGTQVGQHQCPHCGVRFIVRPKSAAAAAPPSPPKSTNSDEPWLIDRNGQRFGPYTVQQLAEYALQGSILQTDLAWRNGMQSWLPVDAAIPTLTFSNAKPHSDVASIAALMKQSPPQKRRSRSGGLTNRVVQIVFGGAIAFIAFFAVRWLFDRTNPSEPASMLSVASGQYPSGVPVGDVQLVRAYLKQETPTGKFEEIEWNVDDPFTTTLDFRTENPMGGMTKTFIRVNRFVDEVKVRLDGFGKYQWVHPSDYGVSTPATPNPNKGKLRL